MLDPMDNELIGISKNMSRIRELINRVAQTGLNIVVCGETGVGKELVVQSLYQKSDRVGKPFVKVNCAALPDSLLESEMFGYEQGAFTGAERRRRGKFEQAHGGVLFLDEIGDMTLPLQSKLLHVLQGGDFTPLGSEKTVKTNAWVIAATNHELEKELTAGRFREDLYFRLSAIKIYIEPLRNRKEDIPYLIDYYIQKYMREFNTRELVMPRQQTIDRLCAYSWPGNVRELQNMLKRILILGDAEENISSLMNTAGTINEPAQTATSDELTISPPKAFDPGEIGDLSALSLKKMRKKAMDQAEREVISYVLKKTAWNRSKATKILKISYKTLLYKIKDLGIHPPPDALG
jgi:transcriptional regulator with GAF, ATPase, and Fis domain